MLVRKLVVVVVLVLAMSSPLPALADVRPPQSAEALAEAIRFRTELGFDAQPDVVRSMYDRGDVTSLGLVLSTPERANLERRADLRQQLDPAVAYVDRNRSSLGGVYFDQSHGDLQMIVRILRDTPSKVIDELNALLPSGAVVRYEPAEHAESALVALRDDLEGLVPSAVDFLAVDVIGNRVQVSAVAGREAEIDKVAADRVGLIDYVNQDVVPSACSSRTVCTPWRGGIKTVADGLSCTWGFNGRPTSGATTIFLMEAGHCSRLNKNVTHNGAIVNVAPGVDMNTFDMIGNQWTDVLSAPLKAFAGAKNVIYINSGSTAYAITGLRTGAVQKPGDSVCMSGAASNPGYKCGTIELEGITLTYARPVDGKTQTFTAMIRASMNHVGGDSGSPMIAGTLPQAFGILAARNTDGTKTYYGPIDLALSDVSLTLCVNAGCS